MTHLRAIGTYVCFSFFMLAVAIISGGCGDSKTTTAAVDSAPNPVPLPSDLHFKTIDQEVQQQQQQFGPLCPNKFRVEVQQDGRVSIQDTQGNPVVQGKMNPNDFAQLAITANDAMERGFHDEVQCENAQSDTREQQGLETQQLFVTDHRDERQLVSSQQSGKACDFTKSKKGKEMHHQMKQIAYQSCGGKLPPFQPPVQDEPAPGRRHRSDSQHGRSDDHGSWPDDAVPQPNHRGHAVPVADPDCTDSMKTLLADFSAAQKCKKDKECNFVDNFSVVDRSTTDARIKQFQCGDNTPKLTVANGDFVQDKGGKLRKELESYLSKCGMGEGFMTSCRASGNLTTNTPPSCHRGSCVQP